MNKMPKLVHLSDSKIKTGIKNLRNTIEPILNNNLHTYFTDHSLSHSDELTRIIDSLIIKNKMQDKLTDNESGLLYSACYLHDLGMHVENDIWSFGAKKMPIKESCASLNVEERRTYIRKYHHLISYKLIIASLVNPKNAFGINLDYLKYPNYTAYLCKAHCMEMNSDYYDMIKDMPNVRLPLLSALLRIADILDESSRRANNKIRDSLKLPLESATHWYRHHYASEIEFKLNEMLIVIHFDFPVSKKESYSRIIPQLQMPNIQDEFNKHFNTLSKYGLGWKLKHSIIEQSVSMSEEMPENVELEMLKQVNQCKIQESLRTKQAVYNAYIEAQPYINNRLRNIKNERDENQPQKYVSDLFGLARKVNSLGAKRSSWNLLLYDYQKYYSTLDNESQLTIGLWLLSTILEDRQPRIAMSLLQKLDETNYKDYNYFFLKARILLDNFMFQDAIIAAKKSIELCENPNKRYEIDTLKQEIYFFSGSLENLLQLSDIRNNMNSDNKFAVRRILISSKIQAMKGNVEQVENYLKNFLSENTNLADALRLQLQLLRAELLFLNGQLKEAHEIFTDCILDLRNSVPLLMQIIITENENLIKLENNSEFNYYEVYDLLKLTGSKLWDPERRLIAEESVREGRHYEALPALWQQFLEAFESGSWRTSFYWSTHISRECLDINWYPIATYYAIQSCNDKLMQEVATKLMENKNSSELNNIIQFLAMICNLRRHFSVFCNLLFDVADGLSDEVFTFALSKVLNYISCASTETELEINLFEKIWKGFDKIGFRVDSIIAEKITRIAINNSFWRSNSPLRMLLVKAVKKCVSKLSNELLHELAIKTLPLSNQLASDYHNIDALELLCAIAHYGSEETKNFIGNMLYPEGQGISIVQMQLANHFNKNIIEPEKLNRMSRNVIEQIKSQVQVYALDEEPKENSEIYLSSIFTVNSVKYLIQVPSLIELYTLIPYLDQLDCSTKSDLIAAILEKIDEPENFISNKINLMDALSKFSKQLSKELLDRIFNSISPIASGEVKKSIVYDMLVHSQHPLSDAKFYFGSNEELVGHAILTLGKIDKYVPNTFSRKLSPILEKSFFDNHPKIRNCAYRVVGLMSNPSIMVLTFLIFGMRDSDKKAAIQAYYALSQIDHSNLNEFHWRFCIGLLELGSRSEDEVIRLCVANTCNKAKQIIPDFIRNRFELIIANLKKDFCFSVRSAFTEK